MLYFIYKVAKMPCVISFYNFQLKSTFLLKNEVTFLTKVIYYIVAIDLKKKLIKMNGFQCILAHKYD